MKTVATDPVPTPPASRIPIIRNWMALDEQDVAIQAMPLRPFVVVAFFGDELVTVTVWAKNAGHAISRTLGLLCSLDWWPTPSRFRLCASIDSDEKP